MTDTIESPTSAAPSTFQSWAQLVRLPNVFTVLADVSGAFLLVAGGPTPLGRWIVVLLAAVALYWAGMVLNDVFDLPRDRQERPGRPLAAGQIPVRQAQLAGWGLLLAGVALAAASGFVPSERFAVTWVPAAIGVALAVMIVAYDGPLKRTPLAPAAMGGCRMLSFLLGASPCIAAAAAGWPFPQYLVAIALGFGIYIMGITTTARNEAKEGPSPNVSSGLMLIVIGACVLAFAPRTAGGAMGWTLSTRLEFPLLIGLIVFPVIVRGLRMVNRPTPETVQALVRNGILTMIPLAAAFALLGAGPIWGLVVFAFAAPAIVLASRFRVT